MLLSTLNKLTHLDIKLSAKFLVTNIKGNMLHSFYFLNAVFETLL